jgi:hypothetical protein
MQWFESNAIIMPFIFSVPSVVKRAILRNDLFVMITLFSFSQKILLYEKLSTHVITPL